MKEPYNVFILPYCKSRNEVKYCIFLRRDNEIWQFITGVGENGKTPIEAAKREVFKEAGISQNNKYYRLTSKERKNEFYKPTNRITSKCYS